jgi:hypothetical protein
MLAPAGVAVRRALLIGETMPDAATHSAFGAIEHSGGLRFYRVHGLVLASEIELPELAALEIALDAVPDVHIRLGAVTRPDGAAPATLDVMARTDGAAVVEVPDVARYLAKDGREIVVAPAGKAHPGLVRTFLLGWAMTLICHQRDLLTLHASAVAFGDQVVAFAGDRGAGKSTLAAHCVEAGGKLVADDLLGVSITDDGVRAHPGVPHLSLWRHAFEALNWSTEGRTPIYWREDKFLVPVASPIEGDTLPLARVYVLVQDESASEAVCESLAGAAAATALIVNTHGWIKSVDVVGRRPGHFKDCARLANRVPVTRLRRRFDPAELPRLAARIAATALGMPPP